MFISSAFEPEDDDVNQAIEDARIARRGRAAPVRVHKPVEISDDSDDELPSLGDILGEVDAPKPKKKV